MGEVDIQKLALTVERHDVRLADVEDSFDEHVKKQNGSLDKIWAELKRIGDRPSWAVAIIIGVLSTICGSLIVYVVTHPGG